MTKIVELNTVDASLDTLRAAPHELRHSLVRVLNEFGLVQLPVLNVRNNTVIDGRLRVRILRDKGVKECEMVCVNLSDKDASLLRLALNNHAGDWNWRPVSDLLHLVNPKLSGFHSMDYNPLLAANWTPGEPNQTDANQFSLEL